MRYAASSVSKLGLCADTNDSPRSRLSGPSWISLLLSPPILPFLLPSVLTHAELVNITIDDTSTSIVYTPSSSWHASSVPCSTCLAPPSSIAFKGTWHHGTHIIPTVDADDLPTDTSALEPGNLRPGEDGSHSDEEDESGSESDGESEDGHGGSKTRQRSVSVTARVSHRRNQSPNNDPISNPFFTPHLDSDDEGFEDQPVSAQFNFTGTCSMYANHEAKMDCFAVGSTNRGADHPIQVPPCTSTL